MQSCHNLEGAPHAMKRGPTRQAGYKLTHLHVELAVDGLVVGIDELECVAAVAVHVPVAVGCAALGEQERHLVSCFRPQTDEVPEHVGVLQIGFRIALLRVNEAGELQRWNSVQ